MKRSEQTWQVGDFYDNLAAAADAVGFEHLGVAYGLAMVPWPSVEDREKFLSAISSIPLQEALDA